MAIASAITTGGVVTVDSTTGFAVTESVRFTGTPFGGLSTSITYWIIALDASTITLSASLYGTAQSFSGGTGTLTLVGYRQNGPGVGNTITANTAGDFNTIQAIASKVLGPPVDATPTFGYNQTVLSAQVPTSGANGAAVIYQSNWANLATDLIKARIHQTGDVNAGNSLIVPTTSKPVSEAFRKNYYDFAQLVLADANTVASNQTLPASIAVAARATVWNGDIQSTTTIDFGSPAGARAFFNAGGWITVACTLLGSFGAKSASKDNTWASMFGAMGTVYLSSNSTYTSGGLVTSGYTSTPTNIGFFQLTTSAQTVFTQTPPSGAYAANSFKIRAYLDGTGRYMYLQCQYNDDSAVTSGSSTFYAGDEYIDGILTQYIGCRRASGSYVSISPPGTIVAGDLQTMSGAPSLFGLSSSSYYVNEGDTFTVLLQTQNVNEGAVYYYTVSGFAATPNGVARYTANATYFTVSGGQSSIIFTIANDLYTDGQTTMTITLNNGLAAVNINVNDSSITPAGEVLITGANSSYGSGTGYYSSNVFTVPPGIYSITSYLVGGGGGGNSYAGGGGGGGQIRTGLVQAVTPGQRIGVIIGGGGGGGAVGGTTQFGSFQALGGSAGTAGSGLSGGTGGTSGGGTGGVGGTSNSAGQVFSFHGGGGGADSGGQSGQTGGLSYNFALSGRYDNWALQWGGGGYGGGSQPGGAATGRGAGDANPWPGVGLAGAPNTGDGGGGGDAAPATPHGNTRADVAITGYGGGGGGSGMVVVTWGP